MKNKPNIHAVELGIKSAEMRKKKIGLSAFKERMTYISSLAAASRKKKK